MSRTQRWWKNTGMPLVIQAYEYGIEDKVSWILSQACFLHDGPTRRTVQKWVQEYRENRADVVSRYQDGPEYSVTQRRKAQHERMMIEIARIATEQTQMEHELEMDLARIHTAEGAYDENGDPTPATTKAIRARQRQHRADSVQLQRTRIEIEREYRQGLATVSEENMDDQAIQDELVSLVIGGAAKITTPRLKRIAEAVNQVLAAELGDQATDKPAE